MEKFHQQHITIVELNDRYFKLKRKKMSPRDKVNHPINNSGLEYIFFNY